VPVGNAGTSREISQTGYGNVFDERNDTVDPVLRFSAHPELNALKAPCSFVVYGAVCVSVFLTALLAVRNNAGK